MKPPLKKEKIRKRNLEVWPPQWKDVKKSPQYMYYMIGRYLEPLPNEEFEHLDDDVYYGDGKSGGTAHQTLKKFLQQVRSSRGYDVDVFPPIDSPFIPVSLDEANAEGKWYMEGVMKTACFALKEINAQAKRHRAGTRYELKDVEKIVETRHLMILLTFTVKEFVCADYDSDSDVVKTVQAMVYKSAAGKEEELIEWRFKPNDDLVDSGKSQGSATPNSTSGAVA